MDREPFPFRLGVAQRLLSRRALPANASEQRCHSRFARRPLFRIRARAFL